MRTIAIIPARGGSKRIPKKSIVPCSGKPMIYWTIMAAKESGLFDQILVSTDSPEIAAVARDFGAVVPFLRDQQFADDQTPAGTATIKALGQMEAFTGEKYEVIVQLMPNCPCRTAEDIKNAYRSFVESGADCQISVFRFGWMNPWWAMKVDKNSRTTKPLFPEALKKRSQDLEELYCPTGAIWIAKVEALKAAGTFYGPDYRVHELDWQSAVDIDEEADLQMAEAVMTTQKARENT